VSWNLSNIGWEKNMNRFKARLGFGSDKKLNQLCRLGWECETETVWSHNEEEEGVNGERRQAGEGLWGGERRQAGERREGVSWWWVWWVSLRFGGFGGKWESANEILGREGKWNCNAPFSSFRKKNLRRLLQTAATIVANVHFEAVTR